jgi:flavin-dependent dehydrogenase
VHDVVIVGGSIAGAATAIALAELGRDVLIIERAPQYRRKACGEGLFPAGVRALERLGLADELRTPSGAIEGVRFHAGGHTAGAPLGGGRGLGIQRAALDQALLARAERAGAQLRRGEAVTRIAVAAGRATGVVLASGEVIAARAVVGADGLHSRVRRLAGLDAPGHGSRYGVSAHVRTPGAVAPFVDVYFEGGYELYVTPVGEGLGNVALLTRRAGMERFAGNLAATFEALLAAHTACRDGFELADEPLAAGPFSRRARRAWRANVVLVGDAAGFFDGISGEGMSVALQTAPLAAAAIDAYLADGAFEELRCYQRARAGIVRNSNLLARLSLAIGARPGTAALAVRNLERRPDTFARLTAINSGDAGLRALRPRDALALLCGL